jgi:hypothetical protein
MAGTAAGAAKRAAARSGAAVPADRRPARKAATGRATKAVARKPTPDELDGMPAAKAEALTEPARHDGETPDDGSVEVEFESGGQVHVFAIRSPGDWRQSAQEALSQGLFAAWARSAMYPKSATLWADLDMTNRECSAFMKAYSAAYEVRYGSDPKLMRRQLGL